MNLNHFRRLTLFLYPFLALAIYPETLSTQLFIISSNESVKSGCGLLPRGGIQLDEEYRRIAMRLNAVGCYLYNYSSQQSPESDEKVYELTACVL
jgi:hypothetical protein